jgi:hypothetical protein
MKALLTLYLYLVITSAIAQSKIDGIGPFKINKTKASDLPGIAQSLNSKFEEVLPDTVEAIKKGRVGEHFAEGSFCPETKKYYSQKVTIAGVDFSNAFVTFYKGKLASFWSKGSGEIEQAITEKYGSGRSGDKSIISMWNNGSIHAISRLTDNPAEKAIDYFTVSDSVRAVEQSDCNDKQFEKIRSSLAKKKGNPLKDL